MAQRRPIVTLPEEEHPAAPVSVHIRRPDGLDLELTGDTAFVERVLVAVGVMPPPSPPA